VSCISNPSFKTTKQIIAGKYLVVVALKKLAWESAQLIEAIQTRHNTTAWNLLLLLRRLGFYYDERNIQRPASPPDRIHHDKDKPKRLSDQYEAQQAGNAASEGE